MTKIIDNSGFWEIKHNPISKVGIFPYLGRSISDECEPDKIYYVYRSADTLAKSVPTWDNPPKPFINDHEMLGEGFSKIDDRPVQGVIHNPVFEDDVLYADISVYSESLKDKIENGKKELSLGYFCKYRKEKGIYKGQAYDYVQEDMVGNHIALVDNGRCGSEVRVFDHKCTMDSLDLIGSFDSEENEELKKNASDGIIKTTEEKDSDMADKREYIRKIMAIAGKPDSDFEGGEKEKIETIAKLLENSEYAKSEDEEEKSEDEAEKEEKAEDKCGKDEEEKEEAEDSEEKEEKAEDSDEEKAEDEEVSPADVMSFLKLILEEVRSINGKKTTDEEEKAEDEEEKKSEDEDDDKKESEDEDEKAEDEDEEKKAEDSSDVLVTFAKDGSEAPKSIMDDVALRKYLNI